jgi:hypothetical protein
MHTKKKSSCQFLSCFVLSFTASHIHQRYAYFKKLDYFSTECIYSPDAYRGHARVFLKDLEAARPSAIIDIIHSGEAFEVREEVKATQKVQRESFVSMRWFTRVMVLKHPFLFL